MVWCFGTIYAVLIQASDLESFLVSLLLSYLRWDCMYVHREYLSLHINAGFMLSISHE